MRPKAEELGFSSQRDGLFAEYPVRRLRPDWHRSVRSGGVLLEIERGKTVTNNMDLLDLWKCHLCAHADHLIVVVPEIVMWTGSRERIYSGVVDRLGTFFEPGNEVNVDSAVIISYE